MLELVLVTGCPVTNHAIAPRPVEAVIFDCDGLLLDTETHWTTAETTLFSRYGKSFGPDHKRRMIGRWSSRCAVVGSNQDPCVCASL